LHRRAALFICLDALSERRAEIRFGEMSFNSSSGSLASKIGLFRDSAPE
jgi:hypothetical protein